MEVYRSIPPRVLPQRLWLLQGWVFAALAFLGLMVDRRPDYRAVENKS
jgi:hypothetical protein